MSKRPKQYHAISYGEKMPRLLIGQGVSDDRMSSVLAWLPQHIRLAVVVGNPGKDEQQVG